MKRRFFFLFFMFVTAIGTQSQTKMIIHQKIGGDIEVMLNDKPVATFEGENLIITTVKTQFSFPISNIGETTYVEDNTTTAIIESVTQLSPEAGLSRIYDINGRIVKIFPAGESINFSTLPQGTYIIKNNYSSYKINRK